MGEYSRGEKRGIGDRNGLLLGGEGCVSGKVGGGYTGTGRVGPSGMKFLPVHE